MENNRHMSDMIIKYDDLNQVINPIKDHINQKSKEIIWWANKRFEELPVGESGGIEQVLNLEDAKIKPSADTIHKRVFCYRDDVAAEFTFGQLYRITEDNLVGDLTYSDYFNLPLYKGDVEDCVKFNIATAYDLDADLTYWHEHNQVLPASDRKDFYFTCAFDYREFESSHIKFDRDNLIDIARGALYHFVAGYDSTLSSIEPADYSVLIKTSTHIYPLYNYPRTVGDLNFCDFAIDGSKLQPSNAMVGKVIFISNSDYTLPDTDPAFYEVAYDSAHDSYYWKEVDAYIYETNELRKYDFLLNEKFLGYKIYQFSNVSEGSYDRPRGEYIVAKEGSTYFWKAVGQVVEQVEHLEDCSIVPSQDTEKLICYLTQNEVSNSYRQSIYLISRDKSGSFVYTEPTLPFEMVRLDNRAIVFGIPCGNEDSFTSMINSILGMYSTDTLTSTYVMFQNLASYSVTVGTDVEKMRQGTMSILLNLNTGTWELDADFTGVISQYTSCKTAGATFNTDFLYPDTYGQVDELDPDDLVNTNLNKILILMQDQVGDSKPAGWYRVEAVEDGGLITYEWVLMGETPIEYQFMVNRGWSSPYHYLSVSNGICYFKASLEQIEELGDSYDPILAFNLPRPREQVFLHVYSCPYWSETTIPMSISTNGELQVEGGLEPHSIWCDITYPVSQVVFSSKEK